MVGIGEPAGGDEGTPGRQGGQPIRRPVQRGDRVLIVPGGLADMGTRMAERCENLTLIALRVGNGRSPSALGTRGNYVGPLRQLRDLRAFVVENRRPAARSGLSNGILQDRRGVFGYVRDSPPRRHEDHEGARVWRRAGWHDLRTDGNRPLPTDTAIRAKIFFPSPADFSIHTSAQRRKISPSPCERGRGRGVSGDIRAVSPLPPTLFRKARGRFFSRRHLLRRCVNAIAPAEERERGFSTLPMRDPGNPLRERHNLTAGGRLLSSPPTRRSADRQVIVARDGQKM